MASTPMPQPQRQPSSAVVTSQERAEVEQAAEEASVSGNLDLAKLGDGPNVFVLDINHESSVFVDQMISLEGSDVRCPAVELSDARLAPLKVLGSVSKGSQFESLRTVPKPQLMSLLKEAVINAAETGLQVREFEPSSARRAFSALLSEFLIQRIKSLRGGAQSTNRNTGPGSIAVPGLRIIVNTRTPNWQILYSPAFFVSLGTVFGDTLSTPVMGTIGPGLFIFGARSSGRKPVFDSIPYPVPGVRVINMLSV